MQALLARKNFKGYLIAATNVLDDLKSKHDLEAAKQMLDEVLENTSHVQQYSKRGQLFEERYDLAVETRDSPELARSFLERSIQHYAQLNGSPQELQALIKLSQLNDKEGRSEENIELYERGLQSAYLPQQRQMLLATMASELERDGNNDEAQVVRARLQRQQEIDEQPFSLKVSQDRFGNINLESD
ncbi:hypothetical protein [uncultured Ruegeria sp.]|uniref:hypothetical protein n=1 Tax=uncultured Ruegeria sp. TaxID=259304 RepID=UPI00261DC2E0|nr:hypothetical protein [uncultured Ruegeria sp.]